MLRVYSVKEAAKRLGVAATTLSRWVKIGRFPNAYKLDPNAKNSPYRIPEEDVEAFEEQRRQNMMEAAE